MSKHTPDTMNKHNLNEQDPENKSKKKLWPSLTRSTK